MDRYMKGKLLSFPAITKDKRLLERARIVAHNFHDPEVGIKLMIYLTREMYNTFSCEEAEWLEFNILSKLHELDSYLLQYEAHNEEIERD